MIWQCHEAPPRVIVSASEAMHASTYDQLVVSRCLRNIHSSSAVLLLESFSRTTAIQRQPTLKWMMMSARLISAHRQSPASPASRPNFATKWSQTHLPLNALLNSGAGARTEWAGVQSRQSRDGTYMNKTASVQFATFIEICGEVWRQTLRLWHAPMAQDICRNCTISSTFAGNYSKRTVSWHIELHQLVNARPSSFMQDCLMFGVAVRSNSTPGECFQQLELRALWITTARYHKLWCSKSRKLAMFWVTDGDNAHHQSTPGLCLSIRLSTKQSSDRKCGKSEEQEGRTEVFERRFVIVKRWSQVGM